MTLTHEQVNQLTGFFQPQEHEFLRGFTYITEGAITTRLDEVDASWTFEILNTTTRNEQITVHARLCVAGVWRDNLGMTKIMTGQNNSETNEPEKAAATDALKRCARLFGIGRYLLDLPSSVKDMDSLTGWLNSRKAEKPAPQAQNSANPAQPDRTHTNTSETPRNPASDVNGLIPYIAPNSKDWWPQFWKYVTPLYDHAKHAQNSVKKMTDVGTVNAKTQTVAEAVAIVEQHVNLGADA